MKSIDLDVELELSPVQILVQQGALGIVIPPG